MKRKIRNKVKLHPVMSVLIIIFGVIILSLLLSIFNFSFSYTTINSSRGEYISTTESIINMFSLHGLKYIFANTVANFANYKVLSNLIIMLIGIGVMEKSGFLQTALGLLTRKTKKSTITFVIILICLLSSIMGDIPFLAIIPLSGLIFKYGKRNPNIGVISSYAALTCGYGLSIFFTSIDSSLANLTTISTKMLDSNFTFNTFSLILFMTVSILVLSLVLTYITENVIAKKLPKNEYVDDLEMEDNPSKVELKGLILSIFASIIYLIIIIYNIIPGLPLSGNFLNYRESLYIDKLFGAKSFFSNGFVFIITILFVIMGLVYGIVAKKIKNSRDFVDALGYSLNGIGKTLVYIFVGSTLISIFKYSNIGNVVVAGLTNLIVSSNFTGLALVFLLFVCSIIATIFVPGSVNKWTIMSSSVVPTFLNAGMSSQFTQLIFRLGECVSIGITPIFAYYIIYLAYLERGSQSKNELSIIDSIRFMLPYSAVTAFTFIALIILWYLINIPLGVNGFVFI